MVIAERHLAIVVRTARAGPATTLVIDRLRPAHNDWCSWQDCMTALAINGWDALYLQLAY